MQPLTKIETMRAMSLHPGIERQCTTTKRSGLFLQPVEQQLPRTSRTPCLVAHQVIHIEPAPLIGVFNDSPYSHANDLVTFYYNGHPRAVGKHYAQPRRIIRRQLRTQLPMNEFSLRQPRRIYYLALVICYGNNPHLRFRAACDNFPGSGRCGLLPP